MTLHKYIKLVAIAAILCIASVLTLAVNAEVIETNDSYVLTGASYINSASACNYSIRRLEGKEYIHITPDLTKASNPTLENTTMDILTDEFGYIKVSYRTNVSSGVPMRLASTDTWEMVAEFMPEADEMWHTAVLEAVPGRKMNPATTKGIKIFFTPLTSVYAETLFENSYTDIEYIGFFRSKEAAENYTAPSVKEIPGSLAVTDEFVSKLQNLDMTNELAYINEEPITYMHFTPIFGSSSNPTVINTSLDIDTNTYRYVTFKYRTNVNTGKNITLSSTDTWSAVASFAPIADGQWHTAVCEMKPGRMLNPKSNKDIANLRIMLTPLTSIGADKLPTDAYTDISSIVFTMDNPVVKVNFYTDYPGMEKYTPAALELSVGDTYTLPENPYNVPNAEFLGWLYLKDAKLYPAGTKRETVTGGELRYAAVFKLDRKLPDVKKLDLFEQGYYAFSGSTDILEHTVYCGKSAMKVKLKEGTDPTKAFFGIYHIGNSGVDLSEYKYMAVGYYYDSEKLPTDTKMSVNLHTNGTKATGLPLMRSSTSAESQNALVSGRWDYAVFDISECAQKLMPSTYPDLQSMQLHPFRKTGEPGNCYGTLYVSSMVFFKEKPDIKLYAKYMNGYDGGIFKPAGNVTRAEACTIAARLATNGSIPKAQSCDFADVAPDSWYYDTVAYCRNMGYLSSYSGNFNPDTAITRAEFTELVYNIGFIKEIGGEARAFTDVDAAHPRYNVICAAAKSGLINGYDNGDGTFSFRPDNTITRAEAVKVLGNARGIKVTVDDLCADLRYLYHDVDPTHWAYADIAAASVDHSETDGQWIELLSDPSLLLGNAARLKISDGEAYLAELDIKTARRIAEIRNTETKIVPAGNVYYVSFTDGNDENDGKTAITPWKTVAKVNKAELASGDTVLFKRGDLFRERLTVKEGVTYSAYGIGEKPRLYGSPEDGADSTKWSLVEGTTDLWVYSTEMTDVGTLVFNGGESYAIKAVPDLIKDIYYVHGSNRTEVYDPVLHMKENEVFSDIKSTQIATAKGKIYYRTSKGNPGEIFHSIEFNTAGNIINVANEENVTIDNLCLKFGGYHGIGSGSTKNLTVTNCEIESIGGCPLNFKSTGEQARFGNGVEIYGSCENYTVDNCYVYQCYDAGITHQYSGGTDKHNSMVNIVYSNNVIEDCVYSVEYFNATDYNHYIRDGRDYVIENNIMRRAGYGWGKQRPDNETVEHIKGWTGLNHYDKDTFIIRNNIFDRSTRSLIQINPALEEWLPIMENNVYIQVYGGYLGEFNRSTDYRADYTADIIVKEAFRDSGTAYIVGNDMGAYN